MYSTVCYLCIAKKNYNSICGYVHAKKAWEGCLAINQYCLLPIQPDTKCYLHHSVHMKGENSSLTACYNVYFTRVKTDTIMVLSQRCGCNYTDTIM